MEKLPHWPKILQAYNADGGAVKCTRNKAWKSAADGAPYKCTGIASGDTIFAPVLGDPKWFRLRQFRDLRSCYEAVSSVANRWVDVLESKGVAWEEDEAELGKRLLLLPPK